MVLDEDELVDVSSSLESSMSATDFLCLMLSMSGEIILKVLCSFVLLVVRCVLGEQGETHPKQLATYMKELYPDSIDQLPHDMPEALGEGINISCFVEADHAGKKITRWSHTGIIIFLNSAPIIWYSKQQNTVESSTFGSELIALKQVIDMIEGLIYKLRMFSIPILGKSRIFCNNQAAVRSGSNPDTCLQKKHNSIAFHRVREAVAGGWILIYHEDAQSNLADLLTKVLSVERRRKLILSLLG